MTTRIKYPRTPHLPWSPGATSDDRMLATVDHFVGQDVVVTAKMDGENTTLYRDHIHARSLDSKPHPSRDWVKGLWSRIRHDIPEGWRVCGENLYAVHSIEYRNLPSYFMVFSIWDHDRCLGHDDTVEWCGLLGLEMVPVLYRGLWNEQLIRGLWTPLYQGDELEGLVVRVSREFRFAEFSRSLAKYVRINHVQTDQHWMQDQVRPNSLGATAKIHS